MNLPSYRKIHLNSADPELIKSQLEKLNFQERPYVIIITHMPDSELVCLGHLDQFFGKNEKTQLPYPPYILTNVKKNFSNLNIVHDESKLPKLYQFKERALNSKETSMFNRLTLLRKNLENLSVSQGNQILQRYGAHNRVLFEKEKELSFYQNILNTLENSDAS